MTTRTLDKLCFLDIETTGLDASLDEIIEVGAAFVEGGVVVSQQRWPVRPGRALPPFITQLTGLTDEALAGAPPFAQVEPELRAALRGHVLVAHNAPFERAFLGDTIAANDIIDSCEVAQLLFPHRASHALGPLVKWLGLGEGARHRALDDALDTFAMLDALCTRFERDGSATQLDAVLEQLPPGALRTFLSQLSPRSSPPLAPQEERSEPSARVSAEEVVRWLTAPAFVCVELEGTSLLHLALDAARSMTAGALVLVALPSGAFRERSASGELPALAYRPVCALTLREALPSLPASAAFARAALASWLATTRLGDAATVSAFVRERLPELDAVLERARTCTCGRDDCFTKRRAKSHWALVSHAHALNLRLNDPHTHIIFVNAERLRADTKLRLGGGMCLLSGKPGGTSWAGSAVVTAC